MDEEQWIDTKEMIASIIFDYEEEEHYEHYIRPHEETCHALAEKIMKALGFVEPYLPEDDPRENR